MSLDLVLYTFIDEDDNIHDDWITTNYKEACNYARANKLEVLQNRYEWVDDDLIDDFREQEKS